MEFNYKNALILGAGISGQGSAYALEKLGVKVTIVTSECLPPMQDDIDLIVVSPAIKPSHEIYKYASLQDIKVLSEIGLGGLLNTKKIIGVTGTNGKTTVVNMIGKVLENAGVKVAVCGNNGVSFARTALSGDYDVVVLELSSFQLLNSNPLHVHIACILNIEEDHIDYHGSFLNYKRAKFNIANFQDKSDFLLLPYDSKYMIATEAKKEYISPIGYELNISGNHNKINAGFASKVCSIYGVSEDVIKSTLSTYICDDYRITFVSKKNGVKYFNDSKGTNVSATISACNTMEGSVALIVGGSDKKLCYDKLFQQLPSSVIAVYVVGDNAKKIIKAAEKYEFDDIYHLENLEQAVKLASTSGVINVLFSPACASFDKYINYVERGQAFDKIVSEIF